MTEIQQEARLVVFWVTMFILITFCVSMYYNLRAHNYTEKCITEQADEIKAEIAKLREQLVAYNKKVYWWEGNDAGKK